MRKGNFEAFAVGLLQIVVTAVVFCLIIKWSWNYVMPRIFGLPEITAFQGFVMNLLLNTFRFNPSGKEKDSKQ